MYLRLFISVLLLNVCTAVYAYDIKLLENTKEVTSRVLKNKEILRNKSYIESRYNIDSIKSDLLSVLSNSIDKLESYEEVCDQRLAKEFIRELEEKKLDTSLYEINEYIKYLRGQNLIDDIFYKIIQRNIDLYVALDEASMFPKSVRALSFKQSINPLIRRKISRLDLNKYFKSKSGWPNGKDICPVNTLKKIESKIGKDLKLKSLDKIRKYNRTIYLKAHKKNIIDYKLLNKLFVFHKLKASDWPLSLSRYLEASRDAKDKLKDELDYLQGDISAETQNTDISNVDKKSKRFLKKYSERKEKLTRREKLYVKYNSRQIILLANVLIDTSKRMNAYSSHITIQYREEDSTDQFETYVISPMEQYRMSLKLLKKDMNNLSLSKLFGGKRVKYDEVISAAYETGVIGLNELKYIIEYEEFWNPSKPVWKQVLDYVFSFSGTASLFLPPPWNVIGAVGVIFAETQVDNATKKTNAKKNSNSIF